MIFYYRINIYFIFSLFSNRDEGVWWASGGRLVGVVLFIGITWQGLKNKNMRTWGMMDPGGLKSEYAKDKVYVFHLDE